MGYKFLKTSLSGEKRGSIMILADIGGTFVRFGYQDGQSLSKIEKFPASDFESFEGALKHYLEKYKIQKYDTLRIATAAYCDDNRNWRFVNNNKWIIETDRLKKEGIPIQYIVNDFEAATWGLLNLEESAQEVLYATENKKYKNKCLLGPGTGLGLGYLILTGTSDQNENYFVQKTHGGHMPLACVTEEQWLVAQTLQRMKKTPNILVHENIVSGPGLLNLYKAVCLIAGKTAKIGRTEDLIESASDALHEKTIRLFHEFFALFAAQSVNHGQAHGGLYLTGGVLSHLMQKNLFDIEHFKSYFCLEAVDSVREALDQTPIIYVKEPYLPLKGLMVLNNV